MSFVSLWIIVGIIGGVLGSIAKHRAGVLAGGFDVFGLLFAGVMVGPVMLLIGLFIIIFGVRVQTNPKPRRRGLFDRLDDFLSGIERDIDNEIEISKKNAAYDAVRQDEELYTKVKKTLGTDDDEKINEYIDKLRK